MSGRVVLGDGAGKLRETLRDLAIKGYRCILLNLADVTHLDSSGIGLLVSAFARLNNLGGELKLLNLRSRVKDLLLITKPYTLFEVHDDETAAIASFAVAAPAARG